MQVRLQNPQVTFVYEGHRVKVKGAKKRAYRGWQI